MRRQLIAGNWKMHGSHSANAELLAGIAAARPFACDVAVCVPFPYLSETAVALAGTDIRWGAQDCSAHAQGAYTGEVSVAMLAEFGCRSVIVGTLSAVNTMPRPTSWSPTRPRRRWRGASPQ